MGSVSCDTTKQFTAVFMKLFIPKPHPGGAPWNALGNLEHSCDHPSPATL